MHGQLLSTYHGYITQLNIKKREGVPSNKMEEIVDYAKKYSIENDYSDLSPSSEPGCVAVIFAKKMFNDVLQSSHELFAISNNPLVLTLGLWTAQVHTCL